MDTHSTIIQTFSNLINLLGLAIGPPRRLRPGLRRGPPSSQSYMNDIKLFSYKINNFNRKII